MFLSINVLFTTSVGEICKTRTLARTMLFHGASSPRPTSIYWKSSCTLFLCPTDRQTESPGKARRHHTELYNTANTLMVNLPVEFLNRIFTGLLA